MYMNTPFKAIGMNIYIEIFQRKTMKTAIKKQSSGEMILLKK